MTENHKADSVDGGRAPSIVCEHELRKSFEQRLNAIGRMLAEPEEEDARALTDAMLALTARNE